MSINEDLNDIEIKIKKLGNLFLVTDMLKATVKV